MIPLLEFATDVDVIVTSSLNFSPPQISSICARGFCQSIIMSSRDGNFDQNQGSGSVRFGGAMSSSSVRFD